MKNFLLAFFVLISAGTTAQKNFYYKQIDLRDSANVNAVSIHTDHLGVILIDAYLKGLIKGYKEDIGEEVLKRAPVAPDLHPAWTPYELYYFGEIVSYKGKYYSLQVNEAAETDVPPTQNKNWREAILEGEPVSTRYYFPTAEDTLSKAGFLEKMISHWPEQFPLWSASTTYVSMELVMYNGRTYEAIQDEVKGISPANDNYWQPSYLGMLQFYQARDIQGVRILYDGSVEPHRPQMISLLKYVDGEGFLVPLGLHFYFTDVVQYLNSIDQPMLYSASHGYVGYPQLMIDDVNQSGIVAQLHTALQTRKVKFDKKKISDATAFNQFLSETINDELPSPWRVRQDLTTSDLVLGKYIPGEIEYTVLPVASFSWKSVESVFKGRELSTYRSYLEGNRFNFSMDTLEIDTLRPLNFLWPQAQPVKSYYFLDTHHAAIEKSDTKLQTQVSALWHRMEKDFYTGKVSVINPMVTLFPCDYDWSATTLTINNSAWNFSDFSLNPQQASSLDSLQIPARFTGLLVTYKRVLNKQFVAPEPVEISISFVRQQKGNEDPPFPITYTFLWADLQKYKNDGEIGLLLNDIKSAKLKFFDSHLSYGVMGVLK